MKLLYFLCIIALFSCSGPKGDVPKLTSDFCEKYLQQKPEFSSGKVIVYILNPSECRPCEEEIIQLVRFSKKGFHSIALLPTGIKQPTEIQTQKTIHMDYMKLARHGILNANGSVLILHENKCVFYASIDVPNIDKLLLKIDRFR